MLLRTLANTLARPTRRRFALPAKQTSSASIAEKQRRAIVDASEDLGAALGVGGFGEELSGVLRRVLMSRMVPAETRERLGLRHARGLLLHGPPGTGKTLIARGLARVLGDRKPVVVEGPEVFSHLLGASEQAVRGLFKPADDEWKRLGRASSLHVVVLDECDAIMRKRGGGETGDGSFGGAARDGVVNQLLAKLDGMSQQSNILVIGTTNRLDLVDPAALRPGRLDVQLADAKTANFSGGARGRRAQRVVLALARAFRSDEPDAVVVAADDLLRAADATPVFAGAGGPADQSLDRSGDAAFVEARDACLAAAAAVSAAAATAPAADRKKSLAVGPAGAGKRTLADAVLDAAPDLAFQRAVDAAHFAGRDLDVARRRLVDLFSDARRSPSAAVVLHDLHLLDPRLLPCLAALLREGHADDHRRLALATLA
ncbi:vesicular-fusion protein sec18 [Aureococcus anophagefferens]|nr:vesicular-fusion protein sec18 [Aureococcus anophagefferens]